MSQQPITSMRNFFIVWLGQMVSTIGSSMTSFAIEIWAWEITGKATTLAMVGFFSLLPGIFITPISGLIVDRWNRKLLMILGDTVAVVATIAIIIFYITKNLQIWHLYTTGAVVGTFNQFQNLAYSASVSLMVSKQNYTRASSMNSVSAYSAIIIAPALAGYLYHIIGLVGICSIDIVTFFIAISSVLLINIPKPPVIRIENQESDSIWQTLGFGWQYIQKRTSLLALLIVEVLFCLFHDIGDALYSPMILSRTGNNTLILGTLASAAGFGGVFGGIIVSIWGGFQSKIKGVLLGIISAGLCKVVFGLGQNIWVWIPTQFCSSLSFPLNISSDNAIWFAKVPPNVQGRVFAARLLLEQLLGAVAYLIAGPLADNVFAPKFSEGGSLVNVLGGLLGTGTSAGIALLYVICAMCMFLIGLVGFRVQSLRNLETILPDHNDSCY
ncbi:MAG: MFS transporter [Calothrix sp. C42_A2020_038]|nr:MFS transporter [Calothrix sp. C42_A2020_038]